MSVRVIEIYMIIFIVL